MEDAAERSVLLDLPGDVLMQILEKVDPQSCSESLAITSHSVRQTLTRTGTRRPRPPSPLVAPHMFTCMPQRQYIEAQPPRPALRRMQSLLQGDGGSDVLDQTVDTGHRWRRLEIQVTLQEHLWPAEVRQVLLSITGSHALLRMSSLPCCHSRILSHLDWTKWVLQPLKLTQLLAPASAPGQPPGVEHRTVRGKDVFDRKFSFLCSLPCPGVSLERGSPWSSSASPDTFQHSPHASRCLPGAGQPAVVAAGIASDTGPGAGGPLRAAGASRRGAADSAAGAAGPRAPPPGREPPLLPPFPPCSHCRMSPGRLVMA